MCGRITLTTDDLDEIVAELVVDSIPEQRSLHRARYNAAPSDVLWQVSRRNGRRQLEAAVWGLRAGPRMLVNARAETAATRPAFRDAFAARRCVIPADGFFEWTGPRSARRPLWFHPARGRLLLLAGVFDEPAPGDEPYPRFTILTTTANGAVRTAHDRMPVIIPAERLDEWLDRGGPELLRPAPDDALLVTPVSPRVNDVANDDAACLAPPGPEDPVAERGDQSPSRRDDDDRQGKLF